MTRTKHSDIRKVILTPGKIRKRVKELGRRISDDYAGRGLTVISILKGSIIFCADLLRYIEVPCHLDFVHVSSYKGRKSSGEVRFISDIHENPAGKDILLVEDIADTGYTLSYILRNLLSRGAASVRVCVLLDKPERRQKRVPVHYRGFTIPDEFVVGYGLDYNEKYRSLPYIGVLKREVIKK